MNYLRFVVLALVIVIVFASRMGEPAVAEIVYDNRSDFVAGPGEENAVDSYPEEGRRIIPAYPIGMSKP
jgi:hypothetical protein